MGAYGQKNLFDRLEDMSDERKKFFVPFYAKFIIEKNKNEISLPSKLGSECLFAISDPRPSVH